MARLMAQENRRKQESLKALEAETSSLRSKHESALQEAERRMREQESEVTSGASTELLSSPLPT